MKRRKRVETVLSHSHYSQCRNISSTTTQRKTRKHHLICISEGSITQTQFTQQRKIQSTSNLHAYDSNSNLPLNRTLLQSPHSPVWANLISQLHPITPCKLNLSICLSEFLPILNTRNAGTSHQSHHTTPLSITTVPFPFIELSPIFTLCNCR